jgi:hypothetical protein
MTAISPHIAGLRLRPPWRSQPIGGRDVESRRSLVAGAASPPALAAGSAAAVTIEAVPLPASVIPDDPDAELVALGERLKAASAETDKLNPHHLHEACPEAAGFSKRPTGKARAAAERRFYGDGKAERVSRSL